MKSIFDVETVKSDAEKISETLLNDVNVELQRRVNLHRDSFYAFWYSKGATPQQICNAMGENAALFFSVAQANVVHIASVAELAGKSLGDFLTPEQYTPPKQITYNPDGTVTVED